jgi:cell division septation protein DedD
MSDGRDDEPGEHQQDDGEWEEERPRSLFSTLWFRALLILVVLGAVAAVSMPYLTDTSGTSQQSQAPDGSPSAPAAQADSTAATPAAASTPADMTSTTQRVSPPVSPKPSAPAPASTAKDASPSDARKPDAPAGRVAKAPDANAAARRPAMKLAGTASGDWFVQVGAFRDRATAERTANALKQRGYTVQQSTTSARRGTTAPTTTATTATTAAGIDRYDVIVTGAAANEITQRLSSRGLAVETVRDGAVVKPSLALRDAVALSNDLRSEGYKVNVRRVGKRAAPKAVPAMTATATAAGETLHRVRVGAFADRAAAAQAADRLRQLGYGVYIARGRE